MKNGKKEPQKASDKKKSKPIERKGNKHESGNDEFLSFPTSLNAELEELLQKDKKRFFGGCGG